MPLKYAELLRSILSCPSAPFREKHVIDRIQRELAEHRVPHFIDPVGNIVVGVASKKDYLKLIGARSKEPLRIFIAHTDHPGFHGKQWLDERRFEFKWYGGSPTRELNDAKVWLASADGPHGEAIIESAELNAAGSAISQGVIRVSEGNLSKKYSDPRKLYGGFHFRDFVWQEGELIYSKAADDLVGSFAITSLALNFLGKGKSKKKRAPFIGLLTRAEEVGFIGAIGHFELGWFKKAKRPILGVSLETSRTLPGAEIGKGPVVRLGDKATVFSSNYLRVFSEIALKALPGQHQKRIMDGGTCEATAATVYGIPCVGISVPLGNYHNQSFQGGPDSRGELGPAPEFVHETDIEGLIALCEALLQPGLPWSSPWSTRQKEFKKSFKGYQTLLKSGP